MTQPDFFLPSVFTVSQLTDEIKLVLEENFYDLKVEGEVSNAKKSANGHTYFTLKDEDAQLSCVIWRGVARGLGTEPLDGQQIIAEGDLQVYPPHGKYQLIVRSISQAGVGALQEAFEKLKTQLKEEGLFDEKHKQPLPPFPMTIGVITSETGAAFHDIRDTLERRWPVATVILHHASVQGVNAAPELVNAIEYFSEKQVDLLIIGRGGGSLEDLWPFNEEAVARALFDCRVPTISAVGHEVDFAITDFVADARAATPTQAAILATPDINEIRMLTDDLSTRLVNLTRDKIESYREKVFQLETSHALMSVLNKLTNARERMENLSEKLAHKWYLQMISKKDALRDLLHRLDKLNPNEPLERGFVRVHQKEEWIKRAKSFKKENEFVLEWVDGSVKVKG